MKQKEKNQERTNIIYVSGVIGVLLICEWFFFRNVFPMDALISDRRDGRLTMLLTEHWWNFMIGKEKFSELAMFYPCKDALGYSDLLMGYGIIHSVLRLAGVNMYYAYKITLIIVHVFGTTSMYYLMRYKIKCNELWALFGTIAFCYSNSYAIHIGHTQLNAISFLPLLLILILGFIENFDNRRKRNVYGYSTTVWFVLLTYNSWYIACFTGLFILLFFISYFIMLKRAGLCFRDFWNDKLLHVLKDFLGYAIVMAVLYIPFIKIYIPILKNGGGYSYAEAAIYMPELIDIINVTSSNYMLGWCMSIMKLSERGYGMEVEIGFSIVLLICFVAGFLTYRKQHNIESKNRQQEVTENLYKELAIMSVCIVTMIGIFLPIRISANGVSLWWFVYTFIQVMKSMRAVGRFLLWLSFPMSVVTGFLMNKWQKKGDYKIVAFSACAVVMLILSNINVSCVASGWNASEENAFIQNVKEPPSNVESFYIVDSSQNQDYPFGYQLDAFEIANHYGIKTINGYSGNLPPEWEGIWDPKSEQYESAVFAWVKKYGLKQVYAYDCAANVWMSHEIRLKESGVVDEVFCPEMNMFSISSGLEDWTKGAFAWTSQDFETTICNAKIRDNGLTIRLQTSLSRYMLQNPELIPELSIYVDGEFVQHVKVTDDMKEIVIPMQGHESDLYTVSLRTNCYFIPKDIGENGDTRSLSVALYYIGD